MHKGKGKSRESHVSKEVDSDETDSDGDDDNDHTMEEVSIKEGIDNGSLATDSKPSEQGEIKYEVRPDLGFRGYETPQVITKETNPVYRRYIYLTT